MKSNSIEARLQQIQNRFRNSKVGRYHNKTQPNSIIYEESNIQQNQSQQKEQIIEENIKLKEQIFQLSHQLQEILEKDKNRKRKLGSIHPGDDEQLLKQKKSELRKQQLETLQLKNKIYAIKRQLESVYNNRNMMSKEQELRGLKGQLKALEQQKEGLLKIKNEQQKHIKQANNESIYQNKIQDIKKELSKVKDEAKSTNEKVLQAEKILRKNHQQYIVKQQKLRDLEQKVGAGKQKLKSKKSVNSNVTSQMIRALQQQIGILQEQRRENEKLWQEKIRSIDLEYEQKRLEEEKKMLILKEKQKEFRINEIKIKQLRKLVRHNITANDNGKKEDMSHFRHKRNIKYLDK